MVLAKWFLSSADGHHHCSLRAQTGKNISPRSSVEDDRVLPGFFFDQFLCKVFVGNYFRNSQIGQSGGKDGP